MYYKLWQLVTDYLITLYFLPTADYYQTASKAYFYIVYTAAIWMTAFPSDSLVTDS